MSSGSPEDHVIPVRVVEPIPSSGRRVIIQTQFGILRTTRGQLPAQLLPERPGRVVARIINNNGFGIGLGSSESVSQFLAAIVNANSDIPVRGEGPVYANVIDATGQPTDAVLISVIDEYEVKWEEAKQNGHGKRRK